MCDNDNLKQKDILLYIKVLIETQKDISAK